MSTELASRPIEELERTDPQSDVVARWLGLANPDALVRTFPQVYHPLGCGRRWAIREGEQLVSHLATHEVDYRVASRSMRALLVGSVATHPDHRGQGFAGRLVSYAAEHARSAGCSAVILWSDSPGFFAKFGFVPMGTQFAVEVPSAGHRLSAGDTARTAGAGDLPEILALHSAKPMRVERNLGDLALLLSARPMHTVVLERSGKVVAYACRSKGEDFPGWWHEVGGSDQDVASLVGAATAASETPRAKMLFPPYRRCAEMSPNSRQSACLRLALTPTAERECFVDGLDSI